VFMKFVKIAELLATVTELFIVLFLEGKMVSLFM